MLMVLHFEDASALSGFGCRGLLCSIALLQVQEAWFLVVLPLKSASIQEDLWMKKPVAPKCLSTRSGPELGCEQV